MLVAASFFDGLKEGLESAGTAITDFLPKLIGALLILIVGWIIAKIVRNFLRRILDRVGIDRAFERAGLAAPLSRAGYTGASLIATIAYVVLLFVVFLLAAEALAVERLTDLLSDLVGYLPLVIVAAIILVVAAWIGMFLAELARPWADGQGLPWLADAIRWALVAFGIIAALNTLNVGEEVVNTLFMAIVGAAAVAFAISFGVGGIDTAKQWWRKLAPRDSGPGV